MTQRKDSPLRREQIADAALRLVAENGVGAVTVRRVAKVVGISAAALYRHYKDKASILAAVLDEHYEILSGDIRRSRAEAKGPLDALHRLYVRSMALVARYCALPVVFLSDALWTGDVRLRRLLLAHHNALRAAFLELIRAAQASGEIRKDIGADQLLVFYEGLVAMPALMRVRCVEDVDLARQTDANWALFTQAMQRN